jgi:hypothetical protein
VHLIDNAGPFVDTLKNGEAVPMPQKNLDSIVEPNLTRNDPGQRLLTPDCFRPTSRGANELHRSSKMGSPGLKVHYGNVGPPVATSDVATSGTKLRPLDAGTSHSTETAFDGIIVGGPRVNPDGLIPPPHMLGSPFCPLKEKLKRHTKLGERTCLLGQVGLILMYTIQFISI